MIRASEKRGKSLLTLILQNDGDVVLARRRARQMAALLDFDQQDQIRIGTAVSEITRNALVHAGSGHLDFVLDDSKAPYSLISVISDRGKGIKGLEDVLAGRTEHVGMRGASKLVDNFIVDTSDKGTRVILQKFLPERKPFTSKEINALIDGVVRIASVSPLDEVHAQNQELLLALEQLAKKQAQLDQLNTQLEEKNEHLQELNAQLSDLNNSLESKVDARTAELLSANEDLKLARDEAIHANALKMQFVSNMSHEIRTPMAGILGLSELLATDEELPGGARKLADNILQASKSLMKIVDDLLDFSKLNAGKIELEESQISIASIVEEVVSSIAPQAQLKKLKFDVEISKEIPNLLWGDSTRIRQSLLNLAQNAVKFTDQGSVSIASHLQSLTPDLAVIRFSVKDTGIGIPAGNQERLFEPFEQVDGTTTRKYGGTGLGLSIVKKLVEMMYGTLGLTSVEGRGSEFWFTVPLKLETPS